MTREGKWLAHTLRGSRFFFQNFIQIEQNCVLKYMRRAKVTLPPGML